MDRKRVQVSGALIKGQVETIRPKRLFPVEKARIQGRDRRYFYKYHLQGRKLNAPRGVEKEWPVPSTYTGKQLGPVPKDFTRAGQSRISTFFLRGCDQENRLGFGPTPAAPGTWLHVNCMTKFS